MFEGEEFEKEEDGCSFLEAWCN